MMIYTVSVTYNDDIHVLDNKTGSEYIYIINPPLQKIHCKHTIQYNTNKYNQFFEECT